MTKKSVSLPSGFYGGPIMKGDFVVVRAHGDRAVVMRVWAEREGVVEVLSPPHFDQRERERQLDEPWPIGFRRDDVFTFDPTLLQQIEAGRVHWPTLKPYSVTDEQVLL